MKFQISISILVLFLIATLLCISCQFRFDQVKWQENGINYRKKALSTIENLEFLNQLTVDNYSEKLGQPKGKNISDTTIMVSYEIKTRIEDGEEVYLEYIQIYFDQAGNFHKYNRDQGTKEKNFERIRTLKNY